MPSSLENAIARNQALTDSGQKVYSAELPPAEAPLPPPLPTVSGLPIRGVLPSSMTESTDFANTTKQGGVPMRSGIFPPQAQPLTTTKTTVVVGAASSSAPAATLALSTNNMTNPSQSKLNFIAGAGMTITSDASGNEVFSAASGSSPVSIFYQIFEQQQGPPANNVVISNFLNGVNTVGGFWFALPYEITTGHVILTINQADATNAYDIGLYGPFFECATSLPLLLNTGAQTYASTGNFKVAWNQGSTVLAPGAYFVFFTTAGGSPILVLNGWAAFYTLYSAYSSATSTGSTLPGSAALPAASESYSAYVSGHTGAGIPQTAALVLTV